MIAPVLAAIALQQGSAPQSAAELLTKMFARYSQAKTVNAVISTSQSAQNVTLLTQTELTFERPSKIRLYQVQKRSTERIEKIILSDGIRVAYTKPENLFGGRYFQEKVANDQRYQTVNTLYGVIGSALPDRSPVLDIMVGGPSDQTYARDQFATFSLAGKVTYRGLSANKITGGWRENTLNSVYSNASVGQFEVYLTDDGELLRYQLKQNFSAPTVAKAGQRAVAQGAPIEVTTIWDVKAEVNVTLDTKAFDLVLP